MPISDALSIALTRTTSSWFCGMVLTSLSENALSVAGSGVPFTEEMDPSAAECPDWVMYQSIHARAADFLSEWTLTAYW